MVSVPFFFFFLLLKSSEQKRSEKKIQQSNEKFVTEMIHIPRKSTKNTIEFVCEIVFIEYIKKTNFLNLYFLFSSFDKRNIPNDSLKSQCIQTELFKLI